MIFTAPCAEGSVRLVQSTGGLSTSTAGIVTLCNSTAAVPSNNNRYIVCDYGWSYEDASVACKSAGYSPYGALALFNQYISSTSGYSFLSYVNCNGSEATLTDCGLQTTRYSCYNNSAGVQCQGSL